MEIYNLVYISLPQRPPSLTHLPSSFPPLSSPPFPHLPPLPRWILFPPSSRLLEGWCSYLCAIRVAVRSASLCACFCETSHPSAAPRCRERVKEGFLDSWSSICGFYDTAVNCHRPPCDTDPQKATSPPAEARPALTTRTTTCYSLTPFYEPAFTIFTSNRPPTSQKHAHKKLVFYFARSRRQTPAISSPEPLRVAP
ncbi:hypothetical protein K432DRAFT_143165 [Lepidopterella palustris CBS 459.81]|uniref:Uncharacterized protein n=1 Tax=Lepidopterella palustris CBS 459.81 TaxID=1314670 RepID=A0A8E2ELU5_9PEZI|nr:hypothetical protein K432DRAFT_143165 [Lepidopterella palustris CBS 459.81]